MDVTASKSGTASLSTLPDMEVDGYRIAFHRQENPVRWSVVLPAFGMHTLGMVEHRGGGRYVTWAQGQHQTLEACCRQLLSVCEALGVRR